MKLYCKECQKMKCLVGQSICQNCLNIKVAKEAIAYHRTQLWRNNDFGLELTSDREREEIFNWTNILNSLYTKRAEG